MNKNSIHTLIYCLFLLSGLAMSQVSANTGKAVPNDHATITKTSTGSVLFVKKGSTGTGSSWQDAIGEVGDALRIAREDATIRQIWVAKGTYYPTEQWEMRDDGGVYPVTGQPRKACFHISNISVDMSSIPGASLYGGFDGTESSVEERNISDNPTILSGELGVDKSTWSLHVVIAQYLYKETVLDGFIIEKGNADLAGGYGYNASGGGIFLNFSSPRMNNIVVQSNYASNEGAGIFMKFADVVANGIKILNNTSAGSGAAISMNNSNAALVNFRIMGNQVTSTTLDTRSIISLTSSEPTFVNTLVTKNNAQGGSVINGSGRSVYMNMTMLDNNGIGLAQSNWGFHEVYNSVVLDNSPLADSRFYSAKNSLIKGSTNPDANNNLDGFNLGASDLFESLDQNNAGYLIPKVDHPLFNAGTTTLPAIATRNTTVSFPTVDLAGQTRVYDQKIDIGAFESQQTGTPFGEVLYVKKGSSGNGTSWASAIGELGDALKVARTTNAIKSIWVAAGIYRPTEQWDASTNLIVTGEPRKATFHIQSDIKVYGGFVGEETSISQRNVNANPTILSGDININSSDWVLHVVTIIGASANTTVDGFTVQKGNPNIPLTQTNQDDCIGGGIYLRDSSPQMNNISINNNLGIGGAGLSLKNSDGQYKNIVVNNNMSQSDILYFSDSDPSFINAKISGNESSVTTGLMSMQYSTVKWINTVITNNGTTNGSALLYSYHPMAKGYIELTSSTVIHPAGFITNNLGNLYARNSILIGPYGNSYQFSSNSIISDGITTDPNTIFTNYSSGDFTLKTSTNGRMLATNPAINTGDNSFYYPEAYGKFDAAGNDRIRDNYIDLGAYEVQQGNNPLPLKLLSFKGEVEDASVRLKWATTEELNTSHFEIENSLNGKNFNKIGTINASETGAHEYSFNVPGKLTQPIVYYRLKMIDLDDSYAYSQIISLRSKELTQSLSFYPNPAISKGVVTVVTSANTKGKLTDLTGHTLTSFNLNQGENSVKLPSLSSGLYIISTDDGQRVKVIVK